MHFKGQLTRASGATFPQEGLPMLADVAPRYLTLWPKYEGYFDDGQTIRPEYEFGLHGLQQLSLNLSLLNLAATFPLTRADWSLAPDEHDRAAIVKVADDLATVFNNYQPGFAAEAGRLITAAGDGIRTMGEAFAQIADELTYWSARGQAVPPSVIAAVIQFARDWTDVAFAAADRFSQAALKLADVQQLLTKIVAAERALRQKAQAAAEAEIAAMQAKIDAMNDARRELLRFTETFRGWVETGRERAQDMLDSIGENLPKVGAGIERTVKYAAIAAGGLALLGLLGAIVYYVPRRKKG